MCYSTVFFFFQAEDGIRDGRVTGVQTCALPILAEAVHRRHQDAVGERLDHVAVAVLDLSGERQLGNAPRDEPCGHRFHFFTVTVVPRPTSETMSNSSVSRLTPGSPRPRPPEVEKPLSMAWGILGIPGPSSR